MTGRSVRSAWDATTFQFRVRGAGISLITDRVDFAGGYTSNLPQMPDLLASMVSLKVPAQLESPAGSVRITSAENFR